MAFGRMLALSIVDMLRISLGGPPAVRRARRLPFIEGCRRDLCRYGNAFPTATISLKSIPLGATFTLSDAFLSRCRVERFSVL
jgi:hypothetical protein